MSNEAPVFAALRTLPVRQFLETEFAPDAVGSNGQSLLHEAIAFGKPEAVHPLLERGAPVNRPNKVGQTPLHYAAIYGSLAAAEALLASGADANACDKHGNNALWASALSSNRQPAIQALLVQAGADAHRKNKAGRSVLDFARQSRNKDLWVLCGGEASEFE